MLSVGDCRGDEEFIGRLECLLKRLINDYEQRKYYQKECRCWWMVKVPPEWLMKFVRKNKMCYECVTIHE